MKIYKLGLKFFKKAVKILFIFIFLIVSLLYIYSKCMYKPGLTVIVENNTNSFIDSLEFRIRDGKENLTITDIPPRNIAKSYKYFYYGLSGMAVHYKNKLSTEVEMPVMYVCNHQSANVLIFSIYSFDSDGNISSYGLKNSADNHILFYEIINFFRYYDQGDFFKERDGLQNISRLNFCNLSGKI
jgi:hypothetical protein